MPDFLAQVLKQFRAVWQQLGGGQRAVIGAVLVGVAALLATLVWLGSRADLVPLASGLAGDDLKQVVAVLDEQGTRYEFRGDGTVLVPAGEANRLRAQLALKGVGRAGQGWDLLDDVSVAAPRFLFNHKLLQARCQVLAEAIRTIKGVADASVIATVPKKALFVEDEEESRVKASVFIRMRDGASIEPLVGGVVNMVSAAIERLEPANVRIMDSATGRSFTVDPAAQDGPVAGLDEAERRAEGLERRAQEFLDASFGPGRTRVMVSVEVDLEWTETKVEERDPESKVPLHRRVRKSTSEGGGTSGGPGVANTVQGNLAGGGGKKEENESEEQFDYKRTTTLAKNPGGRIRRISASVQVDESLKEQRASVEKLVAAALGLDLDDPKGAGKVVVEPVPFVRPEEEKIVSGGLPLERFLGPGAQIGGALVVLLFLRGLLRRGQRGAALPVPAGGPPAAGEPAGAPDPAVERKRLRRELERTMANDPGAVGRLLAVWLQEK